MQTKNSPEGYKSMRTAEDPKEQTDEIANEVLKTKGNEGEAIATGLKQARAHFENHPEEMPGQEKK